MAGERSQLIYGRVKRVLDTAGIKQYKEAVKQVIYDEMNVAQDQIIAEVGLEKRISIDLIENEPKYPLAISNKKIIRAIKETIVPAGWESMEWVPKNKWNDILSLGLTGQPIKAIIIENDLVLEPPPNGAYAGAVIELLVDLQGAVKKLSATVDPELPTIYDRVIEYDVIFNLLNPVNPQLASTYITLRNGIINNGSANPDDGATQTKDSEW